jgi:hypothetical protein
MLSTETTKIKKIFKYSSLQILKFEIPPKRRFKDVHEFTPFFTDRVSKITAPLIALCLLFIILGCSSSGSGSSDNNSPSSLTVAERIAAAESDALAKGCTVVDKNTNYSLLSGGENTYGKNYVSKKGDQTGALETVPGSITIQCGEQVHNFVFASDADQSDMVVNANAKPVGDINEFFQTDKKTQADVEAYITEQLDSTSLCRFSAYPAFTGNITSTPETLSVTVSGKDCGTPLWYINDSSTPAATGNTLVAGAENLLTGENNITVKSTKPDLAMTNSLYLKRTLNALPNQPATAISVSMIPNNAGTDVAPGEYCARTPSITGSFVVTDPDGGSVVVTAWYDDGTLVQSNTITLASGVKTGSETITNGRSTPFLHNHIITFKATADGVPSNTASSKKIA